VCCAKALWCKNKENSFVVTMCHTSIYTWSVLWKILVLQKNCTSRESIKSSCCGKSLSSLYFCIFKILSKNSSFFLLYFNLFPSLFSLCIFRFSSSLVHKTTRQTYSSLKYFLIMTFSGVCVFYFFLSSSCPEPHSSEEKTTFRRCLWTQKTSAACENKSEKNTFWESKW